MNVVKGSDLVGLFGATHRLGDLARFMSIRSATRHALEHGADLDDMRLLLEGWMQATDEPPAEDAVARTATR